MKKETLRVIESAYDDAARALSEAVGQLAELKHKEAQLLRSIAARSTRCDALLDDLRAAPDLYDGCVTGRWAVGLAVSKPAHIPKRQWGEYPKPQATAAELVPEFAAFVSKIWPDG